MAVSGAVARSGAGVGGGISSSAVADHPGPPFRHRLLRTSTSGETTPPPRPSPPSTYLIMDGWFIISVVVLVEGEELWNEWVGQH